MRVGGPYDVEVSFIGCNTEKIEGIYLTIGEEATLDFVLREDSQSIGEVVGRRQGQSGLQATGRARRRS